MADAVATRKIANKKKAAFSETRKLGGSMRGQIVIVTILGLYGLTVLLPFLHEIAKSLSNP